LDNGWKTIIWQQFGAAIDMLENAINACPAELWYAHSPKPEFWYIAFHTLFFLDFYLSDTEAGFVPPAPFTLEELDPAGIMPERPYSQDEMNKYLEHGRQKCLRKIKALTDEQVNERCEFDTPEVTVAELLLYNMRHVQHHTAQLNLILRQVVDSAPRWVRKTNTKMEQ
jgi:hypothetical protein